MVDFDKLRTKTHKPKAIEPTEIFRRLPKPPSPLINDLYTSQAEVLQTWFAKREARDVILNLKECDGVMRAGSVATDVPFPLRPLLGRRENSTNIVPGR